MYNQGMSVVRIRKTNGRFGPVTPADSNNRRISGMSGLGANSLRKGTDTRPDGTPFNTITSWGTSSYQQG
ncbi:MAG: hypothetical protein HC828_17055, partial [Blastochloris sp.]|nr:hypothetical protein [Blastochloris sp.]